MRLYRHHFWLVGCVILGLLALIAGVVVADPGDPTALEASPVIAHPAASSAPDAPNAIADLRGILGADDGQFDVGTEYTADAPPGGNADLPQCRTSSQNFYNKLRSNGYSGSDSFIYGDSLAWEEDWKRASAGGTENNYVDKVDIAYYCDHGSPGAVIFDYGHDDNALTPGDCAGAWGDRDNEWIAFGTCFTLHNNFLGGWSNCLNGTHLVLGYTTLSYDADEGGIWADQMLGWRVNLPIFGNIWLRSPKTVMQAWFSMCDQTQPSSTQARALAEEQFHFNDYLHLRGGVGADVVNNDFWWWDHNCYKPDPLKVDTSQITALPSYEVVQRRVDPGYVQALATALNISGTLQSDGYMYALTDTSGGITRTLEVMLNSGGFSYQNVSALWVMPQPGTPLNLPGPDQARRLADQDLNTLAQRLPGVLQARSDQFAETESVSKLTKGQNLTTTKEDQIERTSVNTMVAYGRRLEVPGTFTKTGQAIQLSVAGPGGATKVYYGGPTATTSQAQGPTGILGGSRQVETRPTSIQIQSADKAWRDFMADNQVAVAFPPVDADEVTRDVAQDSLAYYEQPLGVSQVEMIPVWVFRATYKKAGSVITENAPVYVPASSDYYPPTVTINQPTAGASFQAGEAVTLTATAEGPFAPFTYSWSSNGQALGSGASLTTRLAGAGRPGEDAPQTIEVKVTNANGQTRTVNVSVNVSASRLYMPLLRRAGE